jgi:predicted DNA-binding transcriptional regulator AlpA
VLAAYGGKSKSWLYQNMEAGRIPRPVKIGPNSVAWVTEEIRMDIAAKIGAGPVVMQPRGRRPRKQPVSSASEAA